MKKPKIIEESQEILNWKKEHNWDNLSLDERIALLEKCEKYDMDINDDPPSFELLPNKIDYLRKKPINKLKTKIANFLAKRYIENLIKKKQLIIKEIKGIENLQNVNGGIITCNHFSPLDNFMVQKVFEKVQKKKQKMWKVIREGNYTNPPCLNFFFKHCDTLPLSSNMHTMGKFLKSIKELLSRGDYILIYPEESMWMNYRKPKPLKDGAFKFAVKSNVPVIPIFITMEDIKVDGKDNLAYTINVLPPIYPNKELSLKENIEQMRETNYSLWVKTYEDFYNHQITGNN